LEKITLLKHLQKETTLAITLTITQAGSRKQRQTDPINNR